MPQKRPVFLSSSHEVWDVRGFVGAANLGHLGKVLSASFLH